MEKLKPWDELPKEEQTTEGFDKRLCEPFCPLTRKPCWDVVNPERSPNIPENLRYCRFWDRDYEECVFRIIFWDNAAAKMNERLTSEDE